eukprot:111793-Pelagomonas_calceolata.AAC.1
MRGVMIGSLRLPELEPPSCHRALVKCEEGDSKEEVPGSNPCDRGGDKDALYRWESMGGSSLNARGRTASVNLSFLSFSLRTWHSPCTVFKKKRKVYASQEAACIKE